jgi:hypothetical protein
MTEAEEIQAALVWDLPRLRASHTAGAAAFIEVLQLHEAGRATESAPSKAAQDPLGLAARALEAELNGDSEQATESYLALTTSASLWPSLLGEFLLCWSNSESSADRYWALAQRLTRLEDGIHARLLWKLITWAIDRGYKEVIESLVLQLLSVVPAASWIAQVARTEAMNLGFGRVLPRPAPAEERADFENDSSLLDYTWITWPAADSARTALLSGFVTRARRAGSSTIYIGAPREDRVLAAHLQAEWAGALWLVRPLRQQLAAEILTSPSKDSERAAYACVMWVSGGGSDLRAVLDAAEVRFARDAANYVVKQVATAYRPPFFGDQQLSETLLGLWDELSPEFAAELIQATEVSNGEHPNQGLGRRAFLSLGLRAPQAWVERYRSLPDEVRTAVALELAYLDSSLVPDVMATELASPDMKALDPGSEPDTLGAIALATRLDKSLARSLVAGAAPSVIARVAAVRPELVDEHNALRAARSIVAILNEQVDDAAKGRYGLGPYELFDDYGELLARLPAVDKDLVRPIERLALTPGLPLEMRSGALRVAISLARHDMLSEHTADQLAGVSEYGQSLWNVVSPQLIRAQKLLLAVSFSKEVDRQSEAGLLVASRDPDPAVRNIPLLAIHYLDSAGGSRLLEGVWFAALYDSDSSVTRNALALLCEIDLEYLPAQDLVRDRLRELYATGTRDIRMAVAQAAKRMPGDGLKGDDLLREARNDRSWLVRRLVEQGT